MKTKVKGNKKDINIDIVIENNLLSKNKMMRPKAQKEVEDKTNPKKAGGASGPSVPPNSNMSRLLSEYYGVMAQRELYRQAQPQTPSFNLQQYITPQNPSMTTGVLPNHPPQNNVNEEDDIDDEDEELLNTTIAPEPEDAENAGEDDDQPVLTQPSEPQVSTFTKQDFYKSVIDDPDKEQAFMDSKSPEWQQRRMELIEMITDTSRNRIYLKKADIINYKIGRYVQTYRLPTWKRHIKNSA